MPEAESIAARLAAETPPRPNSHDLAQRLIEGLEGRVARVVVTALRDGIYYARIDLVRDGRTREIDARPSDAIAIALLGSRRRSSSRRRCSRAQIRRCRPRVARYATRKASERQVHALPL